ncbi:T9SS type A sorting domain-containing protein [Hymenobacter negativus]|uniref:T9SS type A sorting domain-containing protein n=1 Tax=Hymenobacter negativus TaxID=2795026 RepID=A0ABS3QL66_9BACT|nr:T9SS type A sorting domain-containing protein [Hymenobacter negativus]MBO2011425.1 T9SS type A sorting domain-containing protein [Hymenobacter negativus]
MKIRRLPSSPSIFSSLTSTRAGVLGTLASLLGTIAQAQQVPKTVLVEHFTNTVCSICASRNPGFYLNLRQQVGTLHIAYHPSSPYRACMFSQQNVGENDARTNFYGVYGGTPRLVLNGSVLPAGQDYAAPSLFIPYQAQTSPFAVAVAIRPSGTDSLTATVRLTTQAAHSYSGLTLYVALVQDTVFYAAPNGEQRHYDVFRKSFTGANALAVVPAAAVGGSVMMVKTVYKDPSWTASRLYAVAIVQDAARQVVQASASQHFGSIVTGVRTTVGSPALRAYPNPTSGKLQLDVDAALRGKSVLIYNGVGQIVRQQIMREPTESLDVSTLPTGTYLVRIAKDDGQQASARFVKAD